MFVQWALLMSDGHLFLFLAVSVFDVVLCTFVSSVYIWRSVAPVQLNLIALNASLTIIIIIIINTRPKPAYGRQGLAGS